MRHVRRQERGVLVVLKLAALIQSAAKVFGFLAMPSRHEVLCCRERDYWECDDYCFMWICGCCRAVQTGLDTLGRAQNEAVDHSATHSGVTVVSR